MKRITSLLFLLFISFTSQVFAGDQDTMGKTKLTFTIVSPGNLAQEGKQLFLSHATWMKSTHSRSGSKALLSYDVSEMDELSNPTDLKSKLLEKRFLSYLKFMNHPLVLKITLREHLTGKIGLNLMRG